MSFLIYFFVLLVSAASVLFGLDLMSSPLPNTPNVPIGRSVQVVSPPPAQQREMRAADERALTPVHPAEPAKPKIQAETSGAAPQQQAKLTPAPAPAPATSVAQAPQSQPAPQAKPEAIAQPTPAATVAQAPALAPEPAPQPTPPAAQPKGEPVATAEPAPAAQPTPAQPAAQPRVTVAEAEPAAAEAKVEPARAESAMTAQQATLHTSNSCNVQACGAAYQSFRAADCSYQPMSGPRRACAISAAASAVSRASKPQEAAREVTGKDEMREVERIIKRQPLQITPSARQSDSNGEMSEVERIVRHMTRGENADVAVQDGDGNVFIVRKSYR